MIAMVSEGNGVNHDINHVAFHRFLLYWLQCLVVYVVCVRVCACVCVCVESRFLIIVVVHSGKHQYRLVSGDSCIAHEGTLAD